MSFLTTLLGLPEKLLLALFAFGYVLGIGAIGGLVLLAFYWRRK